jgi:transposase, IS5 family
MLVAKVHQQQLAMDENKQQRIDDRAISLTQLHIHSIVGGKTGTPVEFSWLAKI